MKKAKETGIGGQCVEFSNLLTWSLLQVNRSPAMDPQVRAMGGLDQDSFMAQMVSDREHAWVEVLLPVVVGSEQQFEVIHLDTMQYDRFAPLFPRHADIKDVTRKNLIQECGRINECLEALAISRTSRPVDPGIGSCPVNP